MSCHYEVRNKLATSRCNGIWETTLHNKTDRTLLPMPIRYGETGVMDSGKTCYGEVANLLQTFYGLNVYVAD